MNIDPGNACLGFSPVLVGTEDSMCGERAGIDIREGGNRGRKNREKTGFSRLVSGPQYLSSGELRSENLEGRWGDWTRDCCQLIQHQLNGFSKDATQ